MVDEKIVKFFEGVLSKTKAGKILWEPTAQEATFIAAIGGEFSLSISSGSIPLSAMLRPLPQGAQQGLYVLVLRDLQGRQLAAVFDTDEGIRPGAMRDLYEAARWQAVHASQRIDDALEVLKSL